MKAKLIFSNAAALKKVNALVHPIVYKMFTDWCQLNPAAPYVIEEAAILFESNTYKKLNANILVCAPMELRIKRIMHRDMLQPQLIEQRMQNQLPDSAKKKLSDYIIENNDTSLLIPQVLKCHELIMLKRK